MSFANYENEEEYGVVSEINMIPMIDIMLVLLIVFIITAPVMHHAFKLDLPQESNVPQEMKIDTIQIAIEVDGKYRWNSEYITVEEMQAKMLQAAVLSPQPEIHLSGDRNVRYEVVIHVISMAQHASLTKIGFVTEPTP
ncbi:MAG: ExbD/TolR family protein [Saezia sp.]